MQRKLDARAGETLKGSNGKPKLLGRQRFHQYLNNGSPQIIPRNHGVWPKGTWKIQGWGRFGELV